MNVKSTCIMACVTLLLIGAATSAQGERPYIGVRLDPAPLPKLLAKHLGLESDQGIRIRNVNIGSPADRAALERDDIIIGFQDTSVTNLAKFIEAVRDAGVGTEVSLEIVHLGRRKTVALQLEPLREDPEWKYPPEPEIVTSWQPGKVFRVGPDGEDWIEIPFDKMPDFNFEIKKFFDERHTYHHVEDGEEFTIIIEGAPDDDDARVIVREGETEHTTTVKDIEALPEKYHEPVRDALENAKRSTRGRFQMRGLRLPRPPRPEVYRKYFEDLTIPRPDLDRWSEKKDQVLEKLQEQMQRLQQRMEELENRNRETLEKLLERKDKGKERSGKPEAPVQPEPPQKERV
jgi:flagellar motility protein MotE (MotC chaperone)